MLGRRYAGRVGSTLPYLVTICWVRLRCAYWCRKVSNAVSFRMATNMSTSPVACSYKHRCKHVSLVKIGGILSHVELMRLAPLVGVWCLDDVSPGNPVKPWNIQMKWEKQASRGRQPSKQPLALFQVTSFLVSPLCTAVEV